MDYFLTATLLVGPIAMLYGGALLLVIPEGKTALPSRPLTLLERMAFLRQVSGRRIAKPLVVGGALLTSAGLIGLLVRASR